MRGDFDLIKNFDQLILSVIFFLIAAAIFLNTGVEREMRQKKLRKERLREQRDQILGHKPSRVERYVSSEHALVKATNTDIRTYGALLVASVIGGFLFGKLIFTDTTVSFFVAGISIVLPHAVLLVKGNRDKRELAENLESAMRIITHEYLSTLDIEKAVENSIDVIEHDKPFREFLVDCKLVSANVERNLRRLETKENNIYFSRWIDQLILTQSDRAQIVNLMPILDDMNDAKTAQRQNESKIAAAWRDYFTLLFIILLAPLLIRFVQPQWYYYLVRTLIGKVLSIALLGSLVWATGRALKSNQPITG